MDKNSAADISFYSLETFTYKYNAVYGSQSIKKTAKMKGVKLSSDGLKVRIVTDGLRKHFNTYSYIKWNTL